MSDIQKLENAFMKAHKAGDKKAAGVLAAEIKRLRGDERQTRTAPEDVAVMLPTGFAKGAMNSAGMFGDAMDLNKRLVSRGAKAIGIPDDYADMAGEAIGRVTMPMLTLAPKPLTSSGIRSSVEGMTGPLPEAQTTAGEYADTIGQWVPGMLIGPGTFGTRAAGGLSGAVASEAAGQQLEGSAWEPWARLGAGVAGGIAGATGWDQIVKALTLRGVDNKAAVEVAKSLEAAGLTPDEAIAKAQSMGPEAMVADLGPATQVKTAAAANADSGAQTLIAERLGNRRAEAPDRIGAALDDTFGPYKDPQSLADDIFATRKPTQPVYQSLDQYVVDTEAAADALQAAIGKYGAGSDIGSKLTTIQKMLVDSKGNLIPGASRVHGVREQLDDLINSAKTAGRGKEARALQEIRKLVDEPLKTQVPGMKEADKVWSDTAKLQEAYDYGQAELLGSKVYPGQNEKTLKAFSGPETEAARQGVRANLEMGAVSASKAPNVGVERTLQKNMNEPKLESLVGKTAMEKISKALDKEATYLETSALAEPSRGSRTEVLNAAREMFGTGARGGDGALSAVIMGTATGNPGAGLMAGGAVKIRDAIVGALTRKTKPEVIKAFGDLMTRQGMDRDAAINLAKAVAAKLPKNSKGGIAASAIANALITSRAAVSVP